MAARRNESLQENLLTDALVDVLRAGGSQTVNRFAAHLCGLQTAGTLLNATSQPTAFTDLRSPRALVLGIAPRQGLRVTDPNLSGLALPDALIETDDLTLLIESKIAGRCERGQLIRHSLRHGLDVDVDLARWRTPATTPAGYHLTTWDGVRSWATAERGFPHAPQAHIDALLERLETTVPSAEPTATRTARAVNVRPAPRPVQISDITAIWDLEQLYAATRTHLQSNPVRTDDCGTELTALRGAFQQAGSPLPIGLQSFTANDTMGPMRGLTALCVEGRSRPAMWPKHWTEWENIHLRRGADRVVLAALLAWARRQRGASRTRAEHNIPLVWALAPERSPGLQAFHEAVIHARLD